MEAWNPRRDETNTHQATSATLLSHLPPRLPHAHSSRSNCQPHRHSGAALPWRSKFRQHRACPSHPPSSLSNDGQPSTVPHHPGRASRGMGGWRGREAFLNGANTQYARPIVRRSSILTSTIARDDSDLVILFLLPSCRWQFLLDVRSSLRARS